MLISSALSLALSLTAAQNMRDATTAPRNTYTACLRAFMVKSAEDKVTSATFDTALPTQCSAQETAFREAMRRREASFRTPAGDVDQIIADELEDARGNIKQLFEMQTTPA